MDQTETRSRSFILGSDVGTGTQAFKATNPSSVWQAAVSAGTKVVEQSRVEGEPLAFGCLDSFGGKGQVGGSHPGGGEGGALLLLLGDLPSLTGWVLICHGLYPSWCCGKWSWSD